MRDEIVSFILSAKAGATVIIGSPSFAGMASYFGWVEFDLAKFSVSAAGCLSVVMAVTHICENVRKNREHKSILRERELKIEILEKQLREDKK